MPAATAALIAAAASTIQKWLGSCSQVGSMPGLATSSQNPIIGAESAAASITARRGSAGASQARVEAG
jgi:hypothetical protein